MQVISNRIADAAIYSNKSFYEEPKEYYSLVLSSIMERFPNPDTLLDIGCANGSFLYHAQNLLQGVILSGAEPVADLATIARQNTGADLLEVGLFDIPENKQYQIITMLGVIGIFFDVEAVLTKLRRLKKPGGAIFIFSPFNEEDIDVILNYRRAPHGTWESGHNLFSKCTMESVSKELGMECEWLDFAISKSIPKTDDPMRSWTEPFRDNKNHLIYGTNMFSTMKLLIIR